VDGAAMCAVGVVLAGPVQDTDREVARSDFGDLQLLIDRPPVHLGDAISSAEISVAAFCAASGGTTMRAAAVIPSIALTVRPPPE
jgi:hypothetical protein